MMNYGYGLGELLIILLWCILPTSPPWSTRPPWRRTSAIPA